ncbi:MAG TPA: hypothetical protein VOA64_04240 [Candidatus Dormibacteraeota bacterium]|nr:hypothetical protein [Candidatus Dormibacteraeota bacterium]
MSSQIERMQKIWHRYDSSRNHKPTSMKQAAAWAVADGLLQLPEVDPLDILADQMSRAVREEYGTDEQGRRYRLNHAVRVTRGGVQYTFWGVMGYAPHDHMEMAFGQRREQVVGDNLQLKIDVDVYNDMTKGKHPPIQLVLDYTEDVAEREQLMKMRNRRDAA